MEELKNIYFLIKTITKYFHRNKKKIERKKS